MIAAGAPAPHFTLRTEDGGSFTREDLAGHTTVLVFYPGVFSSVCTDQLALYERHRDALGDARLLGVSCDQASAQRAFREHLGVSFAQLSDFEPKGAASRAFGAYFEPAGFSNRALVVSGPDAVVRWSHLASSPGELPGWELIEAGLDSVRSTD